MTGALARVTRPVRYIRSASAASLRCLLVMQARYPFARCPTTKIQRLLDRPDIIVALRRKNLGGLTYGDPADGHQGVLRQSCQKMYRAIHTHFRALAELGAVKYRGQKRGVG